MQFEVIPYSFLYPFQIHEDIIKSQENDIEEESEFTIPEIAQEICHCHSSSQGQVFSFDKLNVRDALNNNTVEISFLHDFANALAKEVIDDTLTQPVKSCYFILSTLILG